MRWALAIVPLCLCISDTTPPYEDSVRSIGSTADYEGYSIASETLKNSINFSANPCEDFFDFACGNWITSHPIPEDRVNYDHVEILKDMLQEKLKNMYESNDTFGSRAIGVMKAFYRKCMDKDELNRIGAKRMIENVKSHGVWPALEGDDNWKEHNYNLTSLLIHVFRNRKVFAFINFYPASEKNIRHLLQFERGDLLLDKNDYMNREENRTYIGLLRKRLISEIEQFQKDGGLPTNRSKTEKDVDEIIDLEMRMAEIMDVDVADNMYGLLSHLREMQKILPQVDWSQFFRAVAPSSQQYFDSNPEILMTTTDLHYISSIGKLLRSTDPRIITNYIFVLFSRKWSGEMGEKYEDIEQEYNSAMFGQQQKEPRWKMCTNSTTTLMNDATIALYVKEALQKTTKEEITKIADDLRKQFREKLYAIDWIDDETRHEALYKLGNMLRQIAYPTFVLDIGMLDKHYRDLDMRDTDSYSEMMEKIIQWHIERFFVQLTRAPDRFVIFNPADVHAQYVQNKNSLQIAAGILQPPFFHNTFPRALNYGAIGAVIGHEMTHGFDNEGSSRDAFGNRRKWWSEDVKKKYVQRAQCLIDQYGKIEVPETGLNIDGELTLPENIADNGGVRLAYESASQEMCVWAYKAYLQEHGGQEERIKGLEQFGNEQMFFLGWATIWCGHQTNKELIEKIHKDVHSPRRYRYVKPVPYASLHEYILASTKCWLISLSSLLPLAVIWVVP